MVSLSELAELLREGENSGVEFTRDDVQPHEVAKELVALSNLRGGRILLGVEDDGTISGVVRDAVDEWVLTIARDKVRPPLIPHVQTVTDPGTGRQVAIVTVEAGYAVHAMWHSKHFCYIRAGRQSREASPEELSRLQQQRGGFRAELRPISGTSSADLDQRRLTDYFQRVRGQTVPERDDRPGWAQLLSATEFLVDGVNEPVPCLAAIALFGRAVARYLPQSGIDAVAYPGVEKDYAAIERATLRGPLAPLMTPSGELVEPGLVDSAVAFVRRNVGVRAELADGVRRVEIPGLPTEPVREALVNAVIHRDYAVAERAIISAMRARRPAAAAGLVVLLTGSGVLHFVVPASYDAIVPERLPGAARTWTHLSGVAELVIAALIAAPRTRRFGGLLAALLFVAVFPANVKMAIDWSDRPAWMRALAYGRLPLQIPLVMWAVLVYRRAAVRLVR